MRPITPESHIVYMLIGHGALGYRTTIEYPPKNFKYYRTVSGGRSPGALGYRPSKVLRILNNS
jgi:hypothetical protein